MGHATGFREYLRTLPDDLLACVTQDYVWLATLDFPGGVHADCERRRDFCREECMARGAAHLFWMARDALQVIGGRPIGELDQLGSPADHFLA